MKKRSGILPTLLAALCAVCVLAAFVAPPSALTAWAAQEPLAVPTRKAPLAVGYQDYYAIRADGVLVSWGIQEFGGFGEEVPFEKARELMPDAVAVYTSGRGAVLAVDSAGSLWAINSAQFNDTVPGVRADMEKDPMEPVKVMDGVAMAAAGQNHSLILKRDGTLWVNGMGSFGAPWLEETGSYLVQVMEDVIWADVTSYGGYAVTAGHELWGWGLTSDGRKPHKLLELSGVLQVTSHDMALVMDEGVPTGHVVSWNVDYGTGAVGEPQSELSSVVWCGRGLAIQNTGALWYHYAGGPARMGGGGPRSEFRYVMDDVAYAARGEVDSLAIERDGSLWMLSPEQEGGGLEQARLGGGYYVSAGDSVGLDNFTSTAVYEAGQFSDVKQGDWFAANVKTAFELGLMKGKSASVFAPNETITVAEAITVATRVRDIYYDEGTSFTAKGGAWYQPYVDYALDHKMLSNDMIGSYDEPATRAQMAWLLSCAVPEEALEAVDPNVAFSDVGDFGPYDDAIMTLARAGVLTGKGEGRFDPEGSVLRCEAAAMLSRTVRPSLRLK